MSGFGGQMMVYRQISIDRFDKKNVKSSVFLLSHCHRDHMVGLNQPAFLRCLQSRSNVFLYCSEVTKLLLLSEVDCKSLAPYVRVLEIGVPTTVTIPDTGSEEFQSVVVTTLPAGHCPGSVMFLLEGKEGRALYTGDFRWEKNYATTFPALCYNGHMKEIDSLYIDTTFCVPEAFHIPSRDSCLEATASLVTSWLAHCPARCVHISSRTKYGHEPLLAHLARQAGTKVHTSKEKVAIYEQITELRGIFSEDPSARIHACKWTEAPIGESRLPCGYIAPRESSTSADSTGAPEVMVIRPSTMWFTNEPARLQELVVSPKSSRGLHRVCYSFHSSFSEVRDLVSLLRPRHVFANVMPASDTDWSQVRGRLEKFLTYKHAYHMAPAGDSQAARPLGLLKRKRKKSEHSLPDSEGLVFDSPEKPKRPRQASTSDSRDKDEDEDKDAQQSSQKSRDSTMFISPTKSDTHSSYQGSDHEDNDMFAHSSDDDNNVGDEGQTSLKMEEKGGVNEEEGRGADTRSNSQSLRSYVSGDEEVSEDDQVSSPQFRHLSSRDDLPEDGAPHCLEDDEQENIPASAAAAGDSDPHPADTQKQACPEICAHPTSGLTQKNKAVTCCETDPSISGKGPKNQTATVTDSDKVDREKSEIETLESGGEKYQTTTSTLTKTDEIDGEKSETGMTKNKASELVLASSDRDTASSENQSAQRILPFNCGTGKPVEEDSVDTDSGKGCSEMKTGSSVDSNIDGKSKTMVSETEDKVLNGCDPLENDSVTNGSQPLFSEDENDSQGSEKDENFSLSGKKIEACKPDECIKTQVSPSENPKDVISSEASEMKETSSSETGQKTEACKDGIKTEVGSSENHRVSDKNCEKEECNIISSEDSDSDVDCKITKSSFMRTRPHANPWQKVYPANDQISPPQHQKPPCPLHQCKGGVHSHQHKNNSHHPAQSLAASGEGVVTGRIKPELGVSKGAAMNTTESIDLTEGEENNAVVLDSTQINGKSGGEKREDCEKQSALLDEEEGEKTSVDMTEGKKTGATDTTTTTTAADDDDHDDDADVEDNEEDDDNNKRKAKSVPDSACKDRSCHTSTEASDVIIIDDSDSSTKPSVITGAANSGEKAKEKGQIERHTCCHTMSYVLPKCLCSAEHVRSFYLSCVAPLLPLSCSHKRPHIHSLSGSCMDFSPAKRGRKSASASAVTQSPAKKGSSDSIDLPAKRRSKKNSPEKSKGERKENLALSDCSKKSKDSDVKQKECLAETDVKDPCASVSEAESKTDETERDKGVFEAKSGSEESSSAQKADDGENRQGEKEREEVGKEREDKHEKKRGEEGKKEREEEGKKERKEEGKKEREEEGKKEREEEGKKEREEEGKKEREEECKKEREEEGEKEREEEGKKERENKHEKKRGEEGKKEREEECKKERGEEGKKEREEGKKERGEEGKKEREEEGKKEKEEDGKKEREEEGKKEREEEGKKEKEEEGKKEKEEDGKKERVKGGGSEEMKEEVGTSGEVKEEVGTSGEVKEEVGTSGEVKEEVGTLGEVKEEVGTSGEVKEEIGTSGEVKEEVGTSGEVKEEVGTSGEVKETTGSSGEVKEEAGSSGEINGKGSEDEDSDATIPPEEDNNDDSTIPPDSPVAVHISDSDSDVDCKITQASSPPKPLQSHFAGCPMHQHQHQHQHRHEAHCPLSSAQQALHSAHCGMSSGHHHHVPHHTHDPCFSQTSHAVCPVFSSCHSPNFSMPSSGHSPQSPCKAHGHPTYTPQGPQTTPAVLKIPPQHSPCPQHGSRPHIHIQAAVPQSLAGGRKMRRGQGEKGRGGRWGW